MAVTKHKIAFWCYKDDAVNTDIPIKEIGSTGNTLYIILNDGTKIGIEMNTNVNKRLLNRNLFYMFRIMGRDLKAGQAYNKLNKHIQINFDCEGYHKRPISRYR